MNLICLCWLGLVGLSGAVGADPLISEIMAANTRTLADEEGDFADWIELHNPATEPVDLGGWRLTDSAGTLDKWIFPDVVLAADARMVVFASGKNRTASSGPLHTNFSLGSRGEYLALVSPAGAVVQAFEPGFPAMDDDRSFGPTAAGNQFFLIPTPGAVNSAGAGLGFVKAVDFSTGHGFFTSPVTVALSTPTPGATIRYTVDGATPTPATGQLYTAPLVVAQTTVVRAAAFRDGWAPGPVATQSYFFTGDIMQQSPEGQPPPGWPAGSVGPQLLDYGMDPNVVSGQRRAVMAALLRVPTISLVTDLPNLFDRTTGVYVNPSQRGEEWERPVSVELFNHPGGGFQINAGLRLRGGFSRQGDNPKHSLRLSFRESYGAAKLRYPLFGDRGAGEFDGFDLPTAQDYSWSYLGSDQSTLLRDPWLRDTMRDMGAAHTRSFFCHVYLNGVYWGVYYTEERPEAAFGATYFGGDKNDYDCVKSTGLSGGLTIEVTDGSIDAWQSLWSQARAHAADPTDARYFKMQGRAADGVTPTADPVLLDVPALADYLLTIYYSGCSDAPVTVVTDNNNPNNFFMLRQRGGSRGFAYFIHDGEQALDSPGIDRTGPFLSPNQKVLDYSNPQWLHQDLLGNPEYRLRFADRVHRHFFNGGVFDRDRCVARLDQRAGEVEAAMLAESARWGDAQGEPPFGPAHWRAARDAIRNGFFTNRRDTVLRQLQVDGLYPAVEAPTMFPFGGVRPLGEGVVMSSPAGQIYYTVDGPDPRQVGGMVDPSAVAYAGGVAPPVGLVDNGTVWDFLDTGTPPGDQWLDSSFIPGDGWRTGYGEFGYGDGDETTVVEDNPVPGPPGFGDSDRYLTHYFRTRFTAAAPGGWSSLTLEILRDDGAIAYLNGREVSRANMPEGPVDFLTAAAGPAVGEEERTFYSYPLDPSWLREGDNILAVEVHQLSASTNDMSFNARLTARLPPAAPPLPLPGSAIHRVKARVLSNGQWSALAEAEFLVGAEKATAQNLTVSEIHFRPAASGEEAFVEIANTGSLPVDLRGVQWRGDITFVFPQDTPLLPPGGHIVVVENRTAFVARYGPDVPVAGQWSGNLPSSAGTVRLVGADFSPIEEVAYQSAAPWPEGLTGEGFSLTRVAPERSGVAADPASWRASLDVGGSPGSSDALRYSAWKATHHLDNDADDRDGDGLTALMEYAFGGNPDLPDGDLAPRLIPSPTSSETPSLAVHRRLGSDDVAIEIESSADLAGWRTLAPPLRRQSRVGSGQVVQEFELPFSGFPIFARARLRIAP